MSEWVSVEVCKCVSVCVCVWAFSYYPVFISNRAPSKDCLDWLAPACPEARTLSLDTASTWLNYCAYLMFAHI